MGIVSSMRRRRHEKKAAYKAAKVQAKQTAKATAKRDRANDRYLQKTASKIRSLDAKAAKQQNKKDTETAKSLVAQAKARGINGKKVIGWVGAARVIIPVAAPLVYRALAKLGTSDGKVSSLLSEVGGAKGASTHVGPDAVQRARIADIRNRIGAQRVSESLRSEISRKLATLETTLDSGLSSTVSAGSSTGSGPSQASGTSKEKTLSSVSTELDRLDSQLAAASD